MAGFNLIGSIFQPSEARVNYAPVQYSPKVNSSGLAQKGKLSKSDIGTPNNFKHITHVGFSSLSGLDLDSDVDMKALISLAGVHEDSLKDFEVSKKGSMEHVHKMKFKRKSVERPNKRTKPSSLSSPGITTCERMKRPAEQSPLTAKLANAIPENIPPLNYIQSLHETPSPSDLSSSHFPSKRLPYLKELSRTLSRDPSDPQLLYRRHFKNTTTHPTLLNNKETPSAMASYSCLPYSNHKATKKSFLQPQHPLSQFEKDRSSISSHESSLITFEDLPPVPPLFADCVNLETIIPSLSSEAALSTEFGTVPPAPAFPFKLQSGSPIRKSNEHFLYMNLDIPLKSQVENLTSEEMVLSQQTEQTYFLDQIRQGVQLKSVSQNLKDESSECSSIVGALRAVIQRRHKAIHSSDDEDDDHFDWED